MRIESIRIDGVDYDLVDAGRPFNCSACDFWIQEEAACKLEKELFGWVCPAVIDGRRVALKRRRMR
jgi:hypothetical protein